MVFRLQFDDGSLWNCGGSKQKTLFFITRAGQLEENLWLGFWKFQRNFSFDVADPREKFVGKIGRIKDGDGGEEGIDFIGFFADEGEAEGVKEAGNVGEVDAGAVEGHGQVEEEAEEN